MKHKKRAGYGLLIILLLVALAFGGRAFFLHTVKKKIAAQIQLLNNSGLYIRYDTAYINWRQNEITLENFTLQKNPYDTACIFPEHFSASKILISDLGIITLIFSKELDIEKITIENPRMAFRRNTTFPSDSSKEKKINLQLRVGLLRAQNLLIDYTDTMKCDILSTLKSDLEVSGLRLDLSDSTARPWSIEKILLSSLEIKQPNSLYNYRIKKIDANFISDQLNIDSLRIQPNLPKLAFGRKVGHDIDRIDGSIPFIRLKNFKYSFTDSTTFHAAALETQFYLKIFHDKRLPHKKQFTLLPPQQLKALSFGIDIDSVKVIKSYVLYEEIPPGGDEPGSVYFDDLYASIYNVRNDPSIENHVMEMQAKARFMGTGDVYVKGIFPFGAKQPCSLHGSLRDFDFKGVNPMLEPAANIKVESGRLDHINFKFSYNSTRSDGEVELNYKDLKLVTFKSDKKLEKAKERHRNRNKSEEELKKDQFKTFILNTFLIKKDMDDKVPDEERTGTIMFYRDTERSLFNYWWKSVFSGVKSAFNLDRLESAQKKK
jgi:hypothetical protein